MASHNDQVLLDTDGAAALLLVSRRTIQNWTRQGIIPSVKLGRRRMYLRGALEQHLTSLSEASLRNPTVTTFAPRWESGEGVS
jgi:excisionase family DNA binding protein